MDAKLSRRALAGDACEKKRCGAKLSCKGQCASSSDMARCSALSRAWALVEARTCVDSLLNILRMSPTWSMSSYFFTTRSQRWALNLTNRMNRFYFTSGPQTPPERVLPRNLLSRGLCKIRPMCITSYKQMRKFYSLSAHKPRQIRFCSEIPLVGACVKSVQSTLNLTNGGTNFISLQAPSEQVLPRNLLSRGLCKISPSCITSSKRMNKFYSTIGPQTPSEPVLTRNPLSGGLCKISSAYAKSYKRRNKFYFTTSPV